MNAKQQLIKTGLCSYGLSGLAFHAPFINDFYGFELTKVLERTKEKSKITYPEATIVRSFEELLSDNELELIVVNTPTQLHYEMAKNALLANKHVVLEKPMCISCSEAKELVELAEANELILAVYHNRRLESGFKTLKKIVDDKTLGDLRYFKSHFNREKIEIGPKKWKESNLPGSGMFYDLAPHLIDQALSLFGYPQSIDAKLETQRPHSEVVDYFNLKLGYEQGLIVELEASMLGQGKDEPKYLLKGAKGTYQKQNEDHQEDLLRQGILPSKVDPNKGTITWLSLEQEQIPNLRGGYSDFYSNLFQAIRSNEPLLIKTSEALDVMRIMDEIGD